MAEYHITMRISSLFALFLAFAPIVLAEGLPDLGDTAQLDLTPQMERRVGEERRVGAEIHLGRSQVLIRARQPRRYFLGALVMPHEAGCPP